LNQASEISNQEILEKKALKLVYSLSATGDRLPVQKFKKDKLTEWEDFETGSKNSSIYVDPMFQKNSFLILAISQKWITARKWLIKEEWNSKTKVHPKRKIAEAHRPIGDLLINYWQLGIRCHALQNSSNINISSLFANAGELFSRIFVEIVSIEMVHAFHPVEKIYNNNRKLAWLETERERLRQLKKYKNPFYKYHQTIGLQLIIDCSLDLAKQSDIFERNYWKPYLKAYGAYIKEMSKPEWGRVYEENDKCYIQSGQGRGGDGREFLGTKQDFQKLLFRSIDV
jgi:hypothetical protein